MKKVYLETMGCQMNVSDSERVATKLVSEGYEITEDIGSADVVLLNTCSVREKAEQKLFTQVGRVRQKYGREPVIGVMGCVAQLEGETLFERAPSIDFVLGTKAGGRVGDAIRAAFESRDRYVDLGEREIDYDWSVAEKQRHSKSVAFVPIIEGCNKFCTYCIVPFSRGRERSLPAAEIVRQVLMLKLQGAKEVHLIGQNVNSYRPDTGAGLEGFGGSTSFSRLLRAVAATSIERVKFTTSFPRDFKDDIVDAIEENENLCNWVHLPVQSGSDRILKAMRRLHTIDSYKKKIDRIRSSPKNIAVTTDIIVGFPGETDEDFRQTVELVEHCGYDSAYIFKYSPRPGTPAYAMKDDVSGQQKTERFLELERIQKAVQNRRLQRYDGNTVKVLVERESTKSSDDISGHSTCHKVVNFRGTRDMIGSIKDVRITEIKSNSLYGEVC
ncbi:MAG TPA: tRNA (N6-isopentenyl adenosine(37)-C2)-methylthiotransferase MiaB [Pyrinomonadaceae bacterium]